MGDAHSRLERVTAVVGVVAATMVAVTIACALTVRVGPFTAEGRRDRDAPAVRRVVRDVPDADGLRVELALPGGAWSAASPGTVAGYPRPAGEAMVVAGPVFFRRGWCADDPRWSSRAFAGVVPRVRGASPRGAADRVARAWAHVVAASLGAGSPAGSTPGPTPGSVRARASPLGLEGRSGWLTTRTVALGMTGPCLPPRVSVDVLTIDVAGRVVAVVVVRDEGVPGALTRSASAAFLRQARVLDQSLRSRT